MLYGKLAILKSILDHEKKSSFYYDSSFKIQEINRTKYIRTWYREIADILFKDSKIDNIGEVFENVSFIIFNYDRCFEHFIIQATCNALGIPFERAAEICGTIKIFHPYGTPGALPWMPHNNKVAFGQDSDSFVRNNDIHDLEKRIKIYTEQIDSAESINIKETIVNSERLVFLGFAYHKQNMELLNPIKKPKCKRIFGTAFGLSDSSVRAVNETLHSFISEDSYQEPGRISLEANMQCSQFLKAYAQAIRD